MVANNYFAGMRVEIDIASVAPTVNARGVTFVGAERRGLSENAQARWWLLADAQGPSGTLGGGRRVAGREGVAGLGLQVVDQGTVPAVVDLGVGGTDPGRNAITLNANPAANPPGVNLKSNLVLATPLQAVGSQWEHCDPPLQATPNLCNVAQVAQKDIQLDSGATAPNIGTPIGPRHGRSVVGEIARSAACRRAVRRRRIRRAIDGAGYNPPGLPDDRARPNAAVVAVTPAACRRAARHRHDRRPRVRRPGAPVTPTMLVFEMPVDCYGPATLTVARGNDIRRAARSTASRAAMSTPTVGSSRISSGGLCRMAAPMFTRRW
jgi:hypothetical protein